MSGGCGMNSVANGKLIKNTKYKNTYVPSAPGDSGGAIGAASVLINNSNKKKFFFTDNPYLGPQFSNDEMTPAAGQGAVAIEIASKRTDLNKVLSKINHNPSSISVEIERHIINKLEGGCKTPVGCLATIHKNKLKIEAYLSDISGTHVIRISDFGQLSDKDEIIENMLIAFIDEGAKKIIDSNREALV